MRVLRRLAAAAVVASPAFASAVQVCDLDGQHVNPANGHTTAGKTGLMRCRDGEGGRLVREQELRNGVFMGVVRFHDEGGLVRDYGVNERGNRDGRYREYAPKSGGRVLVVEETYRDGKTVGIARRWHDNGTLRRIEHHGDDGRTQANADFTRDGKLAELRCADRPLLGGDADDAAWCGFRSGPQSVDLHAGNGSVRARVVHDKGERRRIETLWPDGRVREQTEATLAGGVERAFSAEGVKRREVQWQTVADGERKRRVTTLEQSFHESGPLVHEKRYRPTERGAELALETHWYLNGQPRERQEYATGDGKTLRRDARFHDSGKLAEEGVWLLKGRFESVPVGTHRRYDDAGRLRAEAVHDERGRLQRERSLDEGGRVVRDDEVFEDGSRKAHAR